MDVSFQMLSGIVLTADVEKKNRLEMISNYNLKIPPPPISFSFLKILIPHFDYEQLCFYSFFYPLF